MPYYNKVEALTNEEAQKIRHFADEQIKQDNIERGMLVTEREVDNELKVLLSLRKFEVRTVKSIIGKELIDFKKYLRELVEKYKPPSDWSRDVSLGSLYNPLNAEQRQYKQGVRSTSTLEDKSTDEGYSTTWQGDLEEKVRCWLADPDPQNSSLVLLAGYGSGKTTFCRHMAATLAQEYLNASENGDYTYRIPLWIPLLDFTKGPFDLDTFLVAHLKRYCKVDNPDAEALRKMAENSLIFFMFDGFDEMASLLATDARCSKTFSFLRQASNLVDSLKIVIFRRKRHK